ncbi:23S rRNA (guanosine(2251)-2'-O)-methyltransferase RlmB [Mycoplasma wenyonii]|uniref:23S rRNA (Guanosine(2251)-2'-O)-methyltransferase RlmB n=1 Tax=Mycoplasma wenyonii TaxID=65123 RepID=A0A328PL58_9MOLU|nr:23S rRNA (guanosine(2251)-2'-O)-methyltransferase RlmB [Mycoplasma wenyonii]RAO95124.1 23S rRNA (guanosine(2251)-2'-O)-methyltransferase RlmB [Mycoplasma wenyonii]
MIEKKLLLNGRKGVLEVIRNESLRKLIQNVYLSSSQQQLISECKAFSIPYTIKTRNWLGMLQKNTNSKYSDVFASLHSKEQLSFQELIEELSTSDVPECIVMLDKLQDPYNFGAIIRTCLAAGIKYLIYSSTNNVRLNNSVLKTSQGYALQLNLVMVPNLANALERLKKLGFWSYAASLGPNSKSYYEVEFSPKSIILLGNEGTGISKHLESLVDWRIKIPLKNNVDSLNVSVANGILLYEWVRQQLN